MKMTLKILTFCLYLFTYLGCNITEAQSLNNTTFITEDLPPFNYTENNQIKGISVDILTAALKAVDVHINSNEIHVYPWARGYKTVITTPNTCIFSTVRSHERENLFKWAGPIANVNLVFVSIKSTVKLDSLDDLAKVRVSVIRKGIGHQLLMSKGVPEEQLDLSPTVSIMVEKLKRGRVDAILENENVIYSVLKSKGFVWADFKINYVLNLGEIYFAFNRKTPDSVVSTLQKGIDIIRANGTLNKILDNLPIDKDNFIRKSRNLK